MSDDETSIETGSSYPEAVSTQHGALEYGSDLHVTDCPTYSPCQRGHFSFKMLSVAVPTAKSNQPVVQTNYYHAVVLWCNRKEGLLFYNKLCIVLVTEGYIAFFNLSPFSFSQLSLDLYEHTPTRCLWRTLRTNGKEKARRKVRVFLLLTYSTG